jgi:hypothetical protein
LQDPNKENLEEYHLLNYDQHWFVGDCLIVVLNMYSLAHQYHRKMSKQEEENKDKKIRLFRSTYR